MSGFSKIEMSYFADAYMLSDFHFRRLPHDQNRDDYDEHAGD